LPLVGKSFRSLAFPMVTLV